MEASVAGDGACWAEVTRRFAGARETCVVGAATDAAGAVDRVVVLRAPSVPRLRPATTTVPNPDGRAVMERYFDDLGHARFGAAARHFTRDTIYAHPPYRGGGAWVLLRTREALREAWIHQRGPSPARQIVTRFWQERERFFAEGVVEGIPDGGSFVSTGQLTPQGEIARYVAFYSGRRISGGVALKPKPN
ncbi:MAG: hypothetical protein ABSH51_15055 [Solirubrobacteraceae bacterium]